MEFYQLRANGFIGYCDALVARKVPRVSGIDDYEAFLLSMMGTASQMKAISAELFNGGVIKIMQFDDTRESHGYDPSLPTCTFSRPGNTGGQIKTIRSRNVGEIVVKILAHELVLGAVTAAVVCGPDIPTVQERAFLRLDAATSIPLKRSWTIWLWDNVLQPEALFSFGDEELRHAYKISWPDEQEMEVRILSAVRDHTLH